MSTKTPGQILRAAREAWELTYTETGIYDPDWKISCDEASASAVIEMCAEHLRKKRWEMTEEECLQPGVLAIETAIAALRSLKRLPVDGCQAEPTAAGEDGIGASASSLEDGGEA